MERQAIDGLPRIVLRDPEPEELRVLRALQRVMLRHPVAAKAAYSALVAEGERFAETADGRQWKARLKRSSLLHRARLVWEVGSLSVLDGDGSDPLPSSYLDALMMVASSADSDRLLNQLFWEGVPGDPAEAD